MNCEKFKEIISTGYVDSELNREQMQDTEEHLGICADCRQFKEELIKNTVNPFKNIQNAIPPEQIWQNISTAIAANNSARNQGLTGFLKRYMHFPGIPALAAAAVILVLGSSLYFSIPDKKLASPAGYSSDENYLAYLYEGIESTETETTAAEDEYYFS
jgi:hypothetical protein